MLAARQYSPRGLFGLFSLLALACDQAAGGDPVGPLPVAPAAAVMLGTWRYDFSPRAPAETPSLNAGVHVTLSVDVAEGATFRGTVVAWFAGDVGLPPGTFGPIEGTVESNDGVMLVIPFRHPGVPPLTISGRVSGDTLTVDLSRQGGSPGPFATGAVFARRAVS